MNNYHLHPPAWTLTNAINIARYVESVVVQFGYHTAIGGSVLHRGESDKDLDLYLYPHSPDKKDEIARIIAHPGRVIAALDLFQSKQEKESASVINQYVYCMKYEGRRIDIFFMEKYDYPQIPAGPPFE
jgi:hypothetical protein